MKQFENVEAVVIITPEEELRLSTIFDKKLTEHRAYIHSMTNDDLPF
jgi:hypothetical protein